MTLDTELTIQKFNRYHRTSTFQKVQHNTAIANWFQSLVDADEWRLFTCTVVFKPVDLINTKSRFEDEYNTRFLKKIRRHLEPNSKYQATAIPFEKEFSFERYEKSRYRATGKRNPFHIHSVIPIRTTQVHRFWSYDENKLNSRLFKDLNSIDVVQDMLIEPMRVSGPFAWLMYSTKQKEI